MAETIGTISLANRVKNFICKKFNEVEALNTIGELLSELIYGTLTVNVQGQEFRIPKYDKVEFTYIAAGAADDDLIETQVFSLDGDTVATLTYTYIGSTNNIDSITVSYP